MPEKFAKINNVKICYDIQGEGYPVIMVHGFGSCKEIWIAQFFSLSQKFKAIRFDNRGAGKSDRPKGAYTMEIFADDIRGLMDYLKIKKAHVIGWSLGGMIVQNFALKYPERINKIVLINTNYGFPNEQGPEAYKNMRIKELEVLKKDPEKAFWDEAIMGFHRDFRKEMETNPKKKYYNLWSIEDIVKINSTNPPTSQDVEVQAMALNTHKVFERLGEIKNETLLIAASHDRLTPKSCMEEMHEKIPNSMVKIIEKAGHSAPLEKAPEVNKILMEFLKVSKEQLLEATI